MDVLVILPQFIASVEKLLERLDAGAAVPR
jgi:hypothetical protein